MTYLAPRQGLFAIIILISFFIHTTLLVVSTDQQLNERQKQTGKQMLLQLAEEVTLPLLSNDKVSLSVLTGRYISENNVTNLTVKDAHNDIVLQTGQAQLLNGEVLRQQVVYADNIIGEVTLTLQDTSNGAILASQWPFMLSFFIVHLLLWLIYGYIARPTRAQLSALSRDVQDYFLAQHRGQLQRGRRDELPEHDTTAAQTASTQHTPQILGASGESKSSGTSGASALSESKAQQPKPNTGLQGINVQQALNHYVQSHQASLNADNTDNHANDSNSPNNSDNGSSNDTADKNPEHRHSAARAQHIANSHNDSGQTDSHNHSQTDSHSAAAATTVKDAAKLSPASKRTPLLAQRPMTIASVHINFYDPYHLIDKLAPEQATLYFSLCSQLLQRTLSELLKQPLLHGVSVTRQTGFDSQGAVVEFTASSPHSKLALAGAMLAEAYKMLHDITCAKFRELKWFSSDIYIGLSDDSGVEHLQHILHNKAKAGDIYTLLPLMGNKQLSGQVQLNSLQNPANIYERDAAIIKGVSDAMMRRLVDVRNAVLLSAEAVKPTLDADE